jgi:hypothetical protein
MRLENTIHSVLLQYYGDQNAHLFHRKGFFLRNLYLLQVFDTMAQVLCKLIALFKYNDTCRKKKKNFESFGDFGRCGSATRRARRLRVSGRLHASTKHRHITRQVSVLLFYSIACAHFITKHILATLFLTDSFASCTFKDLLLPPLSEVHHYFEIYFQNTHRIPSIELFYIPTHSCTYLL